jgi:hypothetical protein
VDVMTTMKRIAVALAPLTVLVFAVAPRMNS